MNLLPLLSLIAAFSLADHAPIVLSDDDSLYEACAPRKCTDNGTQISYPFWIYGQHPSYCGLPSFNISCDYDRPVLSMITGNNFTADIIFYNNNSLILVDEITYQGSCASPLSNVSLVGTPFDLESWNYKLYFFYNCTSKPSDYYYNVTCNTDPLLHSFAYFYEDVSNYLNDSGNYSCQSVINAPVDVRANESSLTKMTTIDMVRMGFLVTWTADNCTECAGSGGRCGYENKEFVCFCPDGLHPKICGNGIDAYTIISSVFSRQ